MTRKILLFYFLIILFQIDEAQGIDNDKKRENINWTCIHSKYNISHFERWYAVKEDSLKRERKCELIVDCNLHIAYDFLVNPLNASKWMKEVRQTKIFKLENQHDKYAYTTFKLPWPFDDKDLITSYQTIPIDVNHIIIQVIGEENIIQEFDHISRIKGYQARWQLTKLNENKTKIEYTVISDEQPLVPRFIQDPIILRICIRNFEQLKEILAQQ